MSTLTRRTEAPKPVNDREFDALTAQKCVPNEHHSVDIDGLCAVVKPWLDGSSDGHGCCTFGVDASR